MTNKQPGSAKMITVPFLKYTSYGNNFVIVDQTAQSVLGEKAMGNFAAKATNTNFGIGCDNLLVVQACTEQTLAEINRHRRYWHALPSPACADHVFRMFEPDGTEAYSCGNGLISIANFLYQRYRITSTRIMTEVPRGTPSVIALEIDDAGASVVNLGCARRVPDDVASPVIRQPMDECVDLIDDIEVRFRSDDLNAYIDGSTLTMRGYMVFTGEPHLVIFPGESFSCPELVAPLFAKRGSDGQGGVVRRRVSVGTWLVRRIGMFLNEQFRSYFPAGINVNFARVDEARSLIEYRCFERGIFRETLACGTGATAVAVVARRLGKISGRETTLLPHLCRWHDRDAVIRIVERDGGEWCLVGTPRMLVEGNFVMEHAESETGNLGENLVDTGEMLLLENRLLSSDQQVAVV